MTQQDILPALETADVQLVNQMNQNIDQPAVEEGSRLEAGEMLRSRAMERAESLEVEELDSFNRKASATESYAEGGELHRSHSEVLEHSAAIMDLVDQTGIEKEGKQEYVSHKIIDVETGPVGAIGNDRQEEENQLHIQTHSLSHASAVHTGTNKRQSKISIASGTRSSPGMQSVSGQSESKRRAPKSSILSKNGKFQQSRSSTNSSENSSDDDQQEGPRIPVSVLSMPGAIAVGGNSDQEISMDNLGDVTERNNRRYSAALEATALTREELVDELQGEMGPVVEAKVDTDSKKLRWIIVGLLSLVIIAIVGAVVGTQLNSSKSEVGENQTTMPSSSPSMSPSISPSLSPEGSELMEFLVENSPNGAGRSLDDPSSPQYLAFEWLAEDLRITPDLSVRDKLGRYALVTLYYSTNGESWVNNMGWLSHDGHAAICDWRGVECNLSGDDFQIVKLPGNKLTGRLPEEVGMLAVATLDLSENDLTGTIPTSLFSGNYSGIYSLGTLLLGGNDLTGSIPAQLIGLEVIRTLDFSRNQLAGSLPNGLSVLTSLETLELNNNRLTGTLPTTLGTLSRLETFTIGDNDFNSTIPSELGLLQSLSKFEASRCGLHGVLPSDLSKAESLNELVLDQNEGISGTFPSQFGSLTNLQTMSCQRCNLTGILPAQIGNMTSLKTLVLNTNSLTGWSDEIFRNSNIRELALAFNAIANSTIPTTIGLMTSLNIFGITGNRISGSLPSEIGNCVNLERIHTIFNFLTGTIPSQLGNLFKLHHVSFVDNLLTGTIPTELCQLSRMDFLQIASRSPEVAAVSGTIPTCIGELTRLARLNIFKTKVSGTIPSELNQLTKLRLMRMFGNRLTGTVPNLSKLKSLEDLELNSNELSGAIPSSLGALPGLSIAYLEANNFTGSVPDTFCDRTLRVLSADCKVPEVACKCCTICCEDGTRCRQPGSRPPGSGPQPNSLPGEGIGVGGPPP